MSSPSPVHLLVLVHGLWGNVDHLAEMARTIKVKHGDAGLDVLVAAENQNFHTYDGLDWCAERVVKEIDQRITSIEQDGTRKVTRFSITGYSLGGLISRYAIGILYKRKFFENVSPINFNTFATPHIGIPMFKLFFSRLAHLFGSRLLWEQFYGVDNWVDGKPILEVMAETDGIFFRALSKFENVAFYANAVLDRTVPFVTAAVEEYDPFLLHETNGIKIKLNEKYEPVIESWELPEAPPARPKSPPLLKRIFSSSSQPKQERPPRLPPFLRFRFPLNIVLYLSLPLLFPIVLSIVAVRFSIETRASQKRIKLLETELPADERLSGLLAQIETEMDDAVMNIMESNNPDMDGSIARGTATKEYEKVQPTFTSAQRKMIKNLNSLPNLKKRIVFLNNTNNSHGTIISRDMKNFPELHKRGEGGLRHWADHFAL